MTTDLFTTNRHRLAAAMQGGVAVFAANTKMQQRSDLAFTFCQEANFWWLTGIEAADWWLVVDAHDGISWLIAPDMDETHRIFEGELSFGEAKQISGVNTVVTRREGEALLRRLARRHAVVYALGDDPHASSYDFTQNPAPRDMWQRLDRIFSSVQDVRRELTKLRALKYPAEVARIQKAIDCTVQGFMLVKDQLAHWRYEYDLEAAFSAYFRTHGASGHAYEPIVAAGSNACTLHYVQNNARLKKRQVLLLDVGARVDGYAADISRSYAFGEPTKRQRAVHAAVQTVQRQCIALLQPGLPVGEYLKSVDIFMKDALVALGLLTNKNDNDTFRRYFPHAISHGLGVDVHDSLGAPRFFEPGMVVTVEPGIYIPEESLGVRIEDDVLITPHGHKNLSAALSTNLT